MIYFRRRVIRGADDNVVLRGANMCGDLESLRTGVGECIVHLSRAVSYHHERRSTANVYLLLHFLRLDPLIITISNTSRSLPPSAELRR